MWPLCRRRAESRRATSSTRGWLDRTRPRPEGIDRKGPAGRYPRRAAWEHCGGGRSRPGAAAIRTCGRRKPRASEAAGVRSRKARAGFARRGGCRGLPARKVRLGFVGGQPSGTLRGARLRGPAARIGRTGRARRFSLARGLCRSAARRPAGRLVSGCPASGSPDGAPWSRAPASGQRRGRPWALARWSSLGRGSGRQHLLDRLESLELGVAEIEALAGTGVAVGGAEGLGARPVLEGGA